MDTNDDTVMAMAFAIHCQQTIASAHGVPIDRHHMKMEFNYEVLFNSPNQKAKFTEYGFDWDNLRTRVIEAYNGECQVTGRSVNKWMGIYFYDLEGFVARAQEIKQEGDGRTLDMRDYAVCMCEAAWYGMAGLKLYSHEWMRGLITFRYSDLWRQEDIVKASLNGIVNKQYFQKNIFMIGYVDIHGSDWEKEYNEWDGNLFDWNGFDIDEVEDLGDWQIYGKDAHFPHRRLVVYNVQHQIAYGISKDDLKVGLRVLFKKGYEIQKRNKVSLSKKLKNEGLWD